MSGMSRPSRRTVIGSLGALSAAGASPFGRALAAPRGDITGTLARYMVSARDAALPEPVIAACKHRILDTFGAMISGARLRPGVEAVRYVQGLGGTAEASVVASPMRTSAVNAALANAMCAHADETDDFEAVTKAHPGASSVPTALAMAERGGASGMALIRAVALGYDLGCRLLMALGPDLVRATHRSAEGTASTFCALGAAAPLARLDETSMRVAISYAAQQVSGLWSWVDDEDHIEKAFDFAGMGARNGVMAVTMAERGLTGVHDVLDGTHNLFVALSSKPDPAQMTAGLGQRFFVAESAIKRWSVGYPNQSVVDALLRLRDANHIAASNVAAVLVKLPPDAIGIVGNSAMVDVSCQHLVALALVRGAVTFNDSHDQSLAGDPPIRAMKSKVQVVADPALADPAAPRGAIVEVTMTDGRKLSEHTRFPPGTAENPLSTAQVVEKVHDLVAPVIGAARARNLLAALQNLDGVKDVRSLRPFFAG